VAKNTKTAWVIMLPQPGIERVAATPPTRLSRAVAVDVVESQEHLLAFAATLAPKLTVAVVRQSFLSRCP